MKKYNLEERLINFSVSIIDMLSIIKQNKAGNHLSGQVVRSGTSVSLNYGEAQSAESKRDFIHKLKIVLKELREIYITLLILVRSDLLTNNDTIDGLINECNELISIFVKSVETAEKKP